MKVKSRIDFANLIDPETTTPIADGRYLQRLSSQIGELRNKRLLATILESTAKHKRTLVIYGASHYAVQKDALENMLGTPVYLQNGI